MTVQFTEEDEGTPVVDINDARVGTIAVVTDGTAYMNFNDELRATLESTFRLQPTDQGLYPLQCEMINRVKEDKIRLRGDHVAP